MQFAVHKYNQDLTIEADYFRLIHGHKETSGSFGYGNNVSDWTDVAFYRNGNENPVAFVQQPYSVTEIESANVKAVED